jgi:fatty-acyl-CoA synthase
VESEGQLLSISYTSGTTGSPKGVMHSHRGAHQQALAMTHHCGFTVDTRYLWTLPMFHCHGWSNTWAVTAAGGTHVCLRTFSPAAAWQAVRAYDITHFSAAPTVLTMMLAEPGDGPAPACPLRVTTGGAPPTPALIARMEAAGLVPQHLYGLTETIGPSLVNVWQDSWSALGADERALLHARQGIPTVAMAGMRVVDATGDDVPADGATQGEILLRGDTVTSGYYRNPEATGAAIVDGWFRTGDIAVRHEDGYVEVRDRLKDIIISGGENISSVEVERVIDSYPGIRESAVVGIPDAKWGERPVAFVDTGDAAVDDEELTRHVRSRLAAFKAPRTIIRGELPKTATGKIRKDVLRLRAVEAADPAQVERTS